MSTPFLCQNAIVLFGLLNPLPMICHDLPTAPLLHLLYRYKPIESEQDIYQRFVAFVESNPTCLDRSLATGHVTGSAWLVNRSRTQVLLTYHRKLRRWLQLGGHADGERNLLKVAITEAIEESGLSGIEAIIPEIFDLDIHRIPARGHDPEHDHYDVRFVLQAQSDQFTVNHESIELAWVEFDQLDSLDVDESMLRMRDKWRGWLEA